MAVNTTDNRAQYNGNDVIVSFDVPYLFLDNSWIKVILTDSSGNDTNWTEGVEYTLTGAGVAAGGTLVANTAPATGETLTIYRDAPYTQLTTYKYNEAFPSDANEDTVDKNTILIQQVRDLADVLAITFPQSEPTSTSSELPDNETRKGKYLFFNASTGAPTVGVPTGIGVILLDEDDMVSNSDTNGATQQSIKAYVDAEILASANGDVVGPASSTDSHFAQFDGTTGKLLKGGLELDTDDTLAADSDTRVPSQQAVKGYVDASVSVTKPTWATITSPYNTSSGDWVLVQASDVINLPASPTNNQCVNIAQVSGDLIANPVTISGGTKNIDDNITTASTTYSVNTNFAGTLTFVFNTANDKWIIT